MNKITIRFGTTEISREFPTGTTIGQVVGDQDLQAVGGWSDNVKALIGGVEMPTDALAPANGTLVLETAANEKGS